MLAADELETLRQHIRKAEGFLPHAYADTLGFLTIGYGRCIDQRVGGGISVDEADLMLANDMAKCDEDMKGFPWYAALAGPRKVALLSMRFQLGPKKFRGFKKMIAAVAAGDWPRVAAEAKDSKWAKQTPKRAEMIANMLESEVWP